MQVATIIDPEGGRHPCHETRSWDSRVPVMFWCAGMVGVSPEALAERLHTNWFDGSYPIDYRSYESLEVSFPEMWNE